MTKQTFIGSFCELTGISQNKLAALLDTQQSLLSMAGSGQRNLPAGALVVLARLYQQAATVSNTVIPILTDEEKIASNEQAAWSVAQCHPLQKN